MANIEIRQETPTAFYIKVHDTDNVAIIVNDNGLKAGTRFPDGLELIEHIPQGHKVALLDIPANGEIIRYGEVIGYAVRAIHAEAGSTNQWLYYRKRRRYTRCHWQPKSRPLTAAGRIHL
ncbi:galactarate dehydratase [Escherichia coli]|uniref:galactarate dehydratase n=1 Tax=Escherichia coli TaxID=562 RepID=A0A377A9T7_ECOLX|nr:galactarate dehydratase [Escherichia coli]